MSSVNRIIIKYKFSNIIKVQITCEKVSSNNKFLSAPERDVTCLSTMPQGKTELDIDVEDDLEEALEEAED
jgi:hypothetical protein